MTVAGAFVNGSKLGAGYMVPVEYDEAGGNDTECIGKRSVCVSWSSITGRGGGGGGGAGGIGSLRRLVDSLVLRTASRSALNF